jgi:hypothetical protein
VNDDDFALENIEIYEVQFSSPNPSQRVIFGEPTDIYIFDDEVVNIAFQDGNHFVEGLGAKNIVVNINKAIIRMLSVMINSSMLKYRSLNNNNNNHLYVKSLL